MSILEKIVQVKKQEVESRRDYFHLLKRDFSIAKTGSNGAFYKALKKEGLSIIAEYKRSSPSSGILSSERLPGQQSEEYQTGGARAVSVLTDSNFFGGSERDLLSIKSSVSLPVLRKDFIIDEGQLYESFFLGADAVLLIVRILEYEKLEHFLSIIRKSGMDALVEVHSRNELERAIKAGARIIGVNNRDLDTLKVDINFSLNLKSYIPAGIITVSESGISVREHISLLEESGYNAALIGTSLMRSADPAGYILQLTNRGE